VLNSLFIDHSRYVTSQQPRIQITSTANLSNLPSHFFKLFSLSINLHRLPITSITSIFSPGKLTRPPIMSYSKFDATYPPGYLENTHQIFVAQMAETSDDEMPELIDPTSTDDSDSKHDHDACMRMADLAISTGDYPPIPVELDEATAKFRTQAEQLLSILSKMDQTIHKFMPDRSIYVKFKLDEVDARLAGLRERIVKQETLDPREIKRLALHGEYIAPVHELFFVDSVEGIEEMLRVMEASIVVDSEASRPEPALSVDTEGEISLLQILVHAVNKVYIIDSTKLGSLVFTTSITTEQGPETSLKTIFESPHILKLMWDCRGDASMFDRFHGVTLRCVLDVQLMDLATRRGYRGGKGRSRKKVLRDSKTVKAMGQAFHERCTEIPIDVRREWLSIKDFGKLAMIEGYELTQRLYDESRGSISVAYEILGEERFVVASGGSDTEDSSSTATIAHSIPFQKPKPAIWCFDIRPLPPLLEKYASNDVTALPVMYLHHTKHATWNAEVEEHVWLHSEKRLREAREEGSGERLKGNENLAPEGWFEAAWLKGEGEVESG
jgi:hypothetical protein